LSAPVPFVDLGRQHDALAAELQAALARTLDSSGFILGDDVGLFEAEFAAFCGTADCVGVGSGTAALTLALIAAGISTGDEVIVPAHTYVASAFAIIHAGATPVLCDVDAGTGLIDVEHASTLIGARTAAIMPVHLYGQVCDMDAVTALADRHRLFVLEDAAHAHGATFRGRPAGSFGDAAAFSFYPSKNLGALGDGGAVCTSDPGLAERIRQLRSLGQAAKDEHVLVGFNERLDGLQAAMLRVKLRHLDDWNAARRGHAARYAELLADSVGLLAEGPQSPCVYHVFPVRVGDRDGWAARLGQAGIQTRVHYRPSLRDQPVLAPHLKALDELPQAVAWAAEQLSLPMFPELSEAELEFVAGELAGASQLAS
jgi:dTDP-4-amino-4,6-dideoxygalactose transaminase